MSANLRHNYVNPRNECQALGIFIKRRQQWRLWLDFPGRGNVAWPANGSGVSVGGFRLFEIVFCALAASNAWGHFGWGSRHRDHIRIRADTVPRNRDEIVMGNRLYVGNLAYSTMDQQLQEAFSEFGEVTSASVVIDRATGQSRGFGFVEFNSNEEAERAIQSLNGATLDGRSITVNVARERRPSAGGGGGGGGGGGRRFGGDGGGRPSGPPRGGGGGGRGRR
ncbi:MAG TPA: hypothetical protein VMG12_10125 [Polyangiaceae bacterium]|nr:hypothetical protein [Polyangiaceae bacterium]